MGRSSNELAEQPQRLNERPESAKLHLDGSPKWDWGTHAPNNGALPGSTKPSVLSVGERVDRYGTPRGKYLSPPTTSYPERGLPADSIGNGYHVYEAVKPIPVERSIVAPAFGEPGKGTQFLRDKPVSWYVSNGYLKEVH